MTLVSVMLCFVPEHDEVINTRDYMNILIT